MRTRRASALPLALVAVLVCLHGPPASAGCAGPSLAVTPPTAAPGELVVMAGETLAVGECDDAPDTGCRAKAPEPLRPATGMVLELVADGRVHRLAVLDADADLRVSHRFRVPAGAPGPAEVRLVRNDGHAPVTTTLRVVTKGSGTPS